MAMSAPVPAPLSTAASASASASAVSSSSSSAAEQPLAQPTYFAAQNFDALRAQSAAHEGYGTSDDDGYHVGQGWEADIDLGEMMSYVFFCSL